MPGAKVWVLILIGPDVSSAVGPVPYDINSCRSRAVEMNSENIRRGLPENIIRFVCEESDKRPQVSGLFAGQDLR